MFPCKNHFFVFNLYFSLKLFFLVLPLWKNEKKSPEEKIFFLFFYFSLFHINFFFCFCFHFIDGLKKKKNGIDAIEWFSSILIDSKKKILFYSLTFPLRSFAFFSRCVQVAINQSKYKTGNYWPILEAETFQFESFRDNFLTEQKRNFSVINSTEKSKSLKARKMPSF